MLTEDVCSGCYGIRTLPPPPHPRKLRLRGEIISFRIKRRVLFESVVLCVELMCVDEGNDTALIHGVCFFLFFPLLFFFGCASAMFPG